MATNLSVFPIFYILLRNLLGDTLDTLYRVVAWSMHVLLQGTFPDKDWDNKAWEPGTWRSEMAKAKAKIADGWVFLLTEVIGDWKCLKECLKLNKYYAHKYICMFCAASKPVGRCCFTDFRDCAGHRQTFTSWADLLSSYTGGLPGLFSVPGFHIELVHYDWMHCFNLGVLQFVLGNVLTELCKEGRFGRFAGEARVRVGLQLRRAWQKFKRFAKKTRSPPQSACLHTGIDFLA